MKVAELERRSLPALKLNVISSEADADQINDVGALEGVALFWNSLSEDLGGFRERFARGAFAESLENDDPKVIWQHDRKQVFGRVRRGTAQIWEDEEGLKYVATPPDAMWAKDALESIRRGDVDQNSFSFLVLTGGERWNRENGTMVRTVTKARLLEVGPQTEPAYLDTTVAVRSLERANRERVVRAPHADLDLRLRRLNLKMKQLRLLVVRQVPTARSPVQPKPIPHRFEWRQARERAGLLALQVALHESAHAVSFFLHGAGVRSLSIEWKRQGDGTIEITGEGGCVASRQSRLTAADALAGPALERLMGFSWDRCFMQGDFERASDRLERTGKDAHPATVGKAMEQAENLVVRHTPAIRALAAELLDRIELAGPEAERIIRENLDEQALRELTFVA